MDLIDTHQHLILRDRLGYGWTADVPELAGHFTREDYGALVSGHGVVGTVFMETGVDEADYRREARIVSEMVGMGDLPLLGVIASCRPEEDAGFEAWLEECRDLNVVGFRRILHTVPDETSRSEGYRANVRRIGAAGWPVDLCFAAGKLDIAADLVAACPDVSFVVDHCGTNDMASGGFASWRDGMAVLAGFDNVDVKFSGMAAYVPGDAGPDDPLRVVADTVVDLFGPSRLIWGGDWPVVDLGCGLPGWIEISRKFLAGLSEDEQAAIGHRNARRVYGLEG